MEDIHKPAAGRSFQDTMIAAARGDTTGFFGQLLIIFLTPCEWLYRIGLAVYLGLEQLGVRQRTRLCARVVSVGNLTFGGTGKTSVVEQLAKELISKQRPVVLIRGYGGKGSANGLVVSDGKGKLVDWRRSGDEASLLAKNLPGVPVLAGKDRRVTGAKALSEFEAEIILLDDGMQYWQLARDVDIVLLDARCPFGNGHVMPAGMLREPPGGLRRANAVVLTHASEVTPEQQEELISTIHRLSPKAVIHEGRYIPVSIKTSDGGIEPAKALHGRRVLALCGIGSPRSFCSTLREAGADVVAERFYPDHHPFTQKELNEAIAAAGSAGAEWVVTTEKDFIRMDCLVLPSELRILRAEINISDMGALVQLASGWS